MKKKLIAITALSLMVSIFPHGVVRATPSTTYWTPMTMDIQPYGVLHIGMDNYFTVLRKADNGGRSFPTDVGLTMGILPFDKIQLEVGADMLEASDYPFSFNAKIGAPENSLFKLAPALQVGIFNVGTKQNITDQDIGYVVIGKTIPWIGRVSIGPYLGNKKALVDGDGDSENIGFMASFDHGFIPARDSAGNEYNKFVVAADYASGKNAIGGGGCGLYYYFIRDISLLTGPVWFNDEAINGKWKWTIQLDINLPVF